MLSEQASSAACLLSAHGLTKWRFHTHFLRLLDQSTQGTAAYGKQIANGAPFNALLLTDLASVGTHGVEIKQWHAQSQTT